MKLKPRTIFYLISTLLLVSSACFADEDPALFILQQLDLPDSFEVYEDVDEFEIEVGMGSLKFINKVDLINNFNRPVKESVGRAFLNSIANGAVYLHSPGQGHMKHFLQRYVYLCRSNFGTDDFGNPTEHWRKTQFPLRITKKMTKDPGVEEFHLSLKPSDSSPDKWQYISQLTAPTPPPNSASCRVNREWCDYSPNKCEKPDLDADGNEIIGSGKHCEELNCYGGDGKPTIFDIVENMANDSDGFERPDNESGLKFRLEVLDRTPPTFDNINGDNFPDLAKTTPATTGDFYAIEGLVINDNSGGDISLCMILGEILDFPDNIDWQQSESWVKLQARTVESGSESGYIIIPNLCHGIMRYSIFAWDQHGLLNPGEPRITNDKPEESYLLRTPPGPPDLIRNYENALPWHLAYPDSSASAVYEKIEPTDHKATGVIHIRDNDLPNILIRIDSSKHGVDSVFFPPVTRNLQVMPSKDYGAGLNPNQAEYDSFIEAATDKFTSDALANGTADLYFKILDVRRSAPMSDAEAEELHRFKSDKNFIRSQFRLEDYLESDTQETDGEPIKLDLATFGARNSFGEEVTAVLTVPLQEDVEHIIHIWADDNVKWVTIDAYGNPMSTVYSIPSGITSGEATVRVPNQLPGFYQRTPLTRQSSLSDPIKVVFREPTPPLQPPNNLDPSFPSGEMDFCTNNRFPYIEVSVEDYAGFKRKIKLFLQISDENPDVRVIERRNEKR